MTNRFEHVILLITAILIGLVSSAGAVCPDCNSAGCICQTDTEATLIAGQHIDVGLVSVDLAKDVSGNDVIDVTYMTTGGWVLEDAHLYAGINPPTNSAPGQFPYKVQNLGGITEYTFQIPYPAGYVDPCSPENDGTIVDDVFFLAPHAVVSRNGQQESTWANGTLIRERKNWAMYFGVDINVECNDCPVAINDTYEAVEDTTLEVPAGTGVLSNDADEEGNPINVVSNTQPENGAVVLNADGSFAYTPNANYCGPDSFTYAVTDGICDEPVSATVNINVECVNDAPDAVDDTASVDEDSSVIVPVLENDADIDGDSLTIESVSEPASGTATNNGDGTVTYTPDEDYCGDDSFTYTVSDGELTDTATVAITVNCVGEAFDAVDDYYSAPRNSVLYIGGIAPGLFDNDAYTEGDIQLSGLTWPANGGLELSPYGDPFEEGYLIYFPVGDYCGPDSFTYTITNGEGVSDTATVTIDVECDNVCPLAVDDYYETTEKTVLELPAGTGVLANDYDDDGDPLTVIYYSTDGTRGALYMNIFDGSFIYTPSEGFTGEDSFTYAVGFGECEVHATVIINVQSADDNSAPDAADDTASVDEDSSFIVPVLENDVDADGDSLTVESVSEPASGTATDNGDGTITYAPDADFCGADSFQYTISDGELIDTATVTITVNCENTCPVAEDDNYDGIYLDVPADTGLLSNDVDNDGDTITVESYTQPGDGAVTLNPDGSFIYHTLGPGACGEDSFTYTASDGTCTSVGTVTINRGDCVEENACPVATNDVYNNFQIGWFTTDIPASSGVLSNDHDEDGDTLTVVDYTSTGHDTCEITINPDGSFSFSSQSNEYWGHSDTITYYVSDGECIEEATLMINSFEP